MMNDKLKARVKQWQEDLQASNKKRSDAVKTAIEKSKPKKSNAKQEEK